MFQRTTSETMAWLRHEATSGSTAWNGLCLKLQRTARNLPAVYPSALAAAEGTPEEDRVHMLTNVRRGMVAYFDDPNDGNPYGHIVAVAGRNKEGDLLAWTNDAKAPGMVSLVRFSFFVRHWGDSFQFAATSLNGFDLDLPEKKSKAPPTTGRAVDAAIANLEKAIAYHQARGHDAMVRALKADLAELRETKRRFAR